MALELDLRSGNEDNEVARIPEKQNESLVYQQRIERGQLPRNDSEDNMNINETERDGTNRGNINTIQNQHITVTLGQTESEGQSRRETFAP